VPLCARRLRLYTVWRITPILHLHLPLHVGTSPVACWHCLALCPLKPPLCIYLYSYVHRRSCVRFFTTIHACLYFYLLLFSTPAMTSTSPPLVACGPALCLVISPPCKHPHTPMFLFPSLYTFLTVFCISSLLPSLCVFWFLRGSSGAKRQRGSRGFFHAHAQRATATSSACYNAHGNLFLVCQQQSAYQPAPGSWFFPPPVLLYELPTAPFSGFMVYRLAFIYPLSASDGVVECYL